MPSIGLDLYSDLKVSPANEINILDINIPTDSSLLIKSDGLYAAANTGESGVSNPGFVDGVYDGILIKQNVISLDSTVHKTFTATDTAGQNLTNYRPDIDNIYPGDMYRVANGDVYDYYLITNIDAYNNGGNNITASILLGSW